MIAGFVFTCINIGDRQKVLFVFHIHTDTGKDRGVESTPKTAIDDAHLETGDSR